VRRTRRRRKRPLRWVGRILGGLVLALLILGAGGYFWLRSSLPELDGRLVLPGLAGEVRVDRDEHGVPSITAASDADAAFALGFLHAQDRLFQMDMQRRLGAGRLSEVLGAATVGADRTMRIFGFYRLAEAQVGKLSPEFRQVLEAYAAGVNAFLATRKGALPLEYQLIRAEPEKWTPADSLVWVKLMALQLSANYRSELLHARLAQRLSPEQLAVLYPPYPKDGSVTLANVAALIRDLPLDRLHAALPSAVGPVTASNNWVVDGQHSASGKPLLANDPHLGFAAPGTWYLARIVTPGRTLVGATAPGTPFLVIGHNDRIAWGFTTTGGDVEDLFVEQVAEGNERSYLTPDGTRPFETREEEIRVRDAAPVRLTVRSTRHGPIVSDALADWPKQPGRVLALQATMLRDDDLTPEAAWRLGRARDWDSFNASLEQFTAPQQNVVYADVDGNIGFVAPAKVPIRAKGDGWAPVPGWTGEYDWTGFIPFEELPRGFNPSSGRLVSANNKIVPDTYPYFIARDWDVPNRADRINQLLDATPTQSPDASAGMQADTLSLMARDLLPLMLKTPAASPRAQQALDRLRGWDGRMDRDRPEPLLFTAWLRELMRALVADEVGDAFLDYWDLRPLVVRTILTEHQEWCGNAVTGEATSCDKPLADSLDAALSQLTAGYGEDMAAWRWGAPHVALFENAVLSRVPVLRDLFEVSIPADGGYDTLNRGNTNIRSAARPFADVHGAGLRVIFDLADLAASRYMTVPGQSGNPLSPHYKDLLRPWRDFEWLLVEKAAPRHTLTLVPR
jgi:penicillin amidase